MCRSYFFALFACALFSLGALSNAYSNLPGPVIPPVFHLSDSPGRSLTDPAGTSVSTREGGCCAKSRSALFGPAPVPPDTSSPAPVAGSGLSLNGENPGPSAAGSDFPGAAFPSSGETPVLPGEKAVLPLDTPTPYDKAADGETPVPPGAGPAATPSDSGSSVSTVSTDRSPDPSAKSGSATAPGVMPSNAPLNKKLSTSQGSTRGESAPEAALVSHGGTGGESAPKTALASQGSTGGESGLKTALASQESSGKGQPSSRIAVKAASHGLSVSPGDAPFPLNTRTENFNILLLGVDKDKLEMVCVYSINHHFEDPPKSVSLFFPVNSLLQYKGNKETLDSIYAVGGRQALEEVLEKEMFIDIAYYVKIDRQALRDLERYFEPIYVDGEKVQMETLFVRRTSDKDDRIIARILKQVLRREVFFRYIPSLVFGINRDIESNFSFTPQNLVFHYRLAKKLSTKRIEKIVLFGTTDWQEGRRVNIPRKEDLGSAIYLATR